MKNVPEPRGQEETGGPVWEGEEGRTRMMVGWPGTRGVESTGKRVFRGIGGVGEGHARQFGFEQVELNITRGT